jgi:hypothetical protein
MQEYNLDILAPAWKAQRFSLKKILLESTPFITFCALSEAKGMDYKHEQACNWNFGTCRCWENNSC